MKKVRQECKTIVMFFTNYENQFLIEFDVK